MSTDRWEKMAEQVNMIHTVLLGADDQGGLYRQVQGHDKAIGELKGFRNRLAGIWIGASTLLAVLGVKLIDWFNSK